MIKFYYHPSPNPAKVALFLEESGLDYEVIPIDSAMGEQLSAEFKAINPNSKLPALIDGQATLFDSTAILLYLAEKTGQFMSQDTPELHAEFLPWLMFVATGLGPFSGQAVHFRVFAPERIPYAMNRYSYEAERHWKLVDARLADRQYMAGERYSIVDMSVWGWGRAITYVFGDEAWAELPNVKRLYDEISARPAGRRAADLSSSYRFKTELDEETRANMFPQNKRLTEI
jgi:GSH-dependent disulfide-bond oxidoreductase